MRLNSTSVKLAMVALNAAAIVVGVLAGRWLFDAFT
jgi:hypothetical protein